MFFLLKMTEARKRFDAFFMLMKRGGTLRIIEKKQPCDLQLLANVCEQTVRRQAKMNGKAPYRLNIG